MSQDIRQHAARQDGGLRASLELIPPLADEFSVYGGKDTVDRARGWALDGKYLLAQGVPACAHGLYLMGMCPSADGCRSVAGFDHVNVWVEDCGRCAKAFLLFHPYRHEPGASTEAYAAAHGLILTANDPGDDWYGSGTISVRLSVPPDWPLWHIEREALTLLSTQPVTWPK